MNCSPPDDNASRNASRNASGNAAAGERRIEISAPSRLHFGLLCAAGAERLFGGVGVMIDRPGVTLRLTPADAFAAAGRLRHRVARFAENWRIERRLPAPPTWRAEVLSAPPEHVGLGVGTQLGLATAAGLQLAAGLPLPKVGDLAASVGRGMRSAIGAYGFALGGLIVDAGKAEGERMAPLARRLSLPEEWRFVLVRPRESPGLHGAAEQQAFAELPAVSPATTSKLRAILYDEMIPAAGEGRFEAFSKALYAYGRLAGLCFASRQGGPYHGAVVTELVEGLRRMSAAGVGQSSWGPTVFALASDSSAAERLLEGARSRWGDAVDCQVAAVCNRGALIASHGPWGVRSVPCLDV